MSDPADINDRLEAAAIKAEGASEIMRRVANDPAGTTIPTESGGLPSIAEWFEQIGGGIDTVPARVDALEESVAPLTGPNSADAIQNDGLPISQTLDRAGVENEFAWSNVKQNEEDYALLGASLGPDMGTITRVNFDSAGVHGAGTVATMTGPVPGPDLFGHYLVEMRIRTTARGSVNIKLGGISLWPDHPDGYPFVVGGVTTNGIENNRPIDDETYQFVYFTSGTNFSEIVVSTDTSWAGQLYYVKVFPVVRPTKFSVAGMATGANGPHAPAGLKTGAYLSNDLALGDPRTLGVKMDDGNPLPGAHNLAEGANVLASCLFGDQNRGSGPYALMYNNTSNNDASGYSALKMNTKGRENTANGYKSLTSNTVGSRLTASGFHSLWLHIAGDYCSAGGWCAGQNDIYGSANSYWGANSGAMNSGGTSCTYTGAFAGYGTGVAVANYNNITCTGAESWVYGDGGTATGVQARIGTAGSPVLNGTANGYQARVLSDLGTANGYMALAQGVRSTANGEESKAIGQQSVADGALAEANGDYTVSSGAQAGVGNTGTRNTFTGPSAGAMANNYSNVSCVGSFSVTTGSNQVQLGDSATTTYVYGTVQNRSDARDKADIEDTELGIEFIQGLRAVQGRWDIREDYRDRNEDGTFTELERDGSRKRTRLHQWFIAQEVAELCERLGVDFGGLQHHAHNGGDDVFSLGYDEFIPPIVKSLQQCWSRLDDLEARIAALETKDTNS